VFFGSGLTIPGELRTVKQMYENIPEKKLAARGCSILKNNDNLTTAGERSICKGWLL